MRLSKTKWILIGVAAGVAGTLVLTDRRSRPYLKSLVKLWLNVSDGVTEKLEIVREDVQDIVAEARHELDAQNRPPPPPAPVGPEVAQA
jgi:hypothetical protein